MTTVDPAILTEERKPFVIVWENAKITHHTGSQISNMYDLSDCDRMDGVVGVYAVNENNELVKVKLGPLERDPEYDPDSPGIVYAQSPLFAGTRIAGWVHWTDHL